MRLLNLFLVLFGFIFHLSGQGTVLESINFYSNILKDSVKYSVYLPPDYNTSKRAYPSVYLLHGFSDNETGWVQFGNINQLVDKAIASGEIGSMVIVMPNGGVTYYLNDFSGKFRWEDMFTLEFIPEMERLYRIRNLKEYRAIAGLSMGGYGAINLAMKHTNLFSTSVALSAAIRTEKNTNEYDGDKYTKYFVPLFGGNRNDRITETWKNNNVFYQVKRVELNKIKSVRWYIDCGDDDYLSNGNSMLHIAFNELQIPHEFRVRNGEHNWEYWRTGIIPALKYINEGFSK